MAFDACMMRAVLSEFSREFPEAKIEKVLQPRNDEIDLQIHYGKSSRRLVFNVGPNAPRLQLSDKQKENPLKAPMFCMLLRKYFSGAKIVAVDQPDFDRIAEFTVSAYDEMGFKVFFGVELKLINEPNRPEFLLYGLSEQDFLDSYPLYNCTQKELFDFCNEKNVLMVQAHPYRIEQGYAPADMRYVHGVEVYNPHPSFESRMEEAVRLAEENGKIKTSGSDFHVERQAGVAGMIVADDIADQFMLRDFLRSNPSVIFDHNGILLS